VYRRTQGGRQIRRRFHFQTREEVERAILLDSDRHDIGLSWSEGLDIFMTAKLGEGRKARSLENVRFAVDRFIREMGNIGIEDTTPDIFRAFMAQSSTPKVANHHRKELLTVARYLRAHTGKITVIPFEHIPPLPVKATPRRPIPRDKLNAYLDALPPHVRRPVLLILYYGLRSSAVCNLTPESVDGQFLHAVDKGDTRRDIPLDDMLSDIIGGASRYRQSFDSPAERLFVNARGRAWERSMLLRAAQTAWHNAGLERKKLHEVRHTLGTLAGRQFTKGVVQALMGHRSPRSSDVYFHPDEEMATEARQILIRELAGKPKKNAGSGAAQTSGRQCHPLCPWCGQKLRLVAMRDKPDRRRKAT
jgi:integrase